MVKALKADGLMFKSQRHGVGGEERIVEAQHREDSEGRAGGEVERGGDDVGAGALGADQGAGHIEVVFGEQLVKVVAGDTARNARKFFADEVGIFVADAGEASVDFALTAASTDLGRKFLGCSRAHGETGAVVEQHVERFHIVHDFAAHEPVDAATVVADHAAERAAGVRCRVGCVGQVVELGRVAKAVENDAGLDSGQLGCGVDEDQAIHVARIVEDHGYIGALAGETGSGAARKYGRAHSPAGGECSLHVCRVARADDTDRKLAVVGGVGRIERAGAEIEAHLAADVFLEQGFKLAVG